MWNPSNRSPSIGLSGVRKRTAEQTDAVLGSVTGLPAAYEGKKYYEVTLKMNRGAMLVGWFASDEDSDLLEAGIGASQFSWGISSTSGQVGHNRKWSTYTRKMKVGDVVGCKIDLINSTMSFTVNGNDLGIAFRDIPKGCYYYPGVSLKYKHTCVTANFGGSKFKYPPPTSEGYTALTKMPKLEAKEQVVADKNEHLNAESQTYKMFPTELLLHIFMFLDGAGLSVASCVSRLWRDIGSSDKLWHHIFATNFSYEDIYAPAPWRQRYITRYNWLHGRYTAGYQFPCKYLVNTFQFDQSKLIVGAADHLVIFDNCFDNSEKKDEDDEEAITRRLLKAHDGAINSLQFDKEKIVTGANDNLIKIWDVDDYMLIDDLRGHANNIICVRFLKNILASADWSYKLMIWDLNVGTPKVTYTNYAMTNSISFEESGDTMLYSSNKIHLVDLRMKPKPSIVRNFGPNPTMFCRVTGTDQVVAYTKGTSLSVFDIGTGLQIHNLQRSPEVTSLYCHQGLVACGSTDCNITIYDVKTTQLLATIPKPTIHHPTTIQFDDSRLITSTNMNVKCNSYLFGNDDVLYGDTAVTKKSKKHEIVNNYTEEDNAVLQKWTGRMNVIKNELNNE